MLCKWLLDICPTCLGKITASSGGETKSQLAKSIFGEQTGNCGGNKFNNWGDYMMASFYEPAD